MLHRVFSRRCLPKNPLPNTACATSSNVNIKLSYSSSSMSTSSVVDSSAIGLDKLGITNPSKVNRNLSYEDLMAHEKKNGEGGSAKSFSTSYDHKLL